MPAGACSAERSRAMQETSTHRHGGAPVWPRCCGLLEPGPMASFSTSSSGAPCGMGQAVRGLAAMRDHACCVGVGCPVPPRRMPPSGAGGCRPALTWPGALGGWGRPVRGDCGPGAKVSGRGNRLAANVLVVCCCLSKSAMVKTPAVLTVGVSLCWQMYSPAVSGQQLIRARCADPRLVP